MQFNKKYENEAGQAIVSVWNREFFEGDLIIRKKKLRTNNLALKKIIIKFVLNLTGADRQRDVWAVKSASKYIVIAAVYKA